MDAKTQRTYNVVWALLVIVLVGSWMLNVLLGCPWSRIHPARQRRGIM